MADFNKVGLLVLRGDRILLCRKDRDTSKLILPGGRLEPGESDLDCLTREIREELGDVAVRQVEYLGTYEDRAALDDPAVVKTLRIALYRGRLDGTPAPSSEITELVWFGPHSDRKELTPIFLNRAGPCSRRVASGQDIAPALPSVGDVVSIPSGSFTDHDGPHIRKPRRETDTPTMIDEVFPDIYRIQLPLPRNPLRAINSYVIRGRDRWLMVDTGMNRPECLEVMRASLDELAIELDRLDFFITHAHADHVGLVSELRTDASKIFLHSLDATLILHPTLWADMAEAARTYAFPNPGAAVEKHPGRKYLFRGEPEFTHINEGDTVPVGRYLFQCVETPGHTPGHMCLYEPSARILFSGDHILGSITPNISGWGPASDALGDFLASLEKVAAYDIRLTLPGHRHPIPDHRRRIEELKEHHRVRTQEVVNILTRNGQTAYEVASKMRWDISYTCWGDFPIPQKWFATGEALAHLLHLERTGSIARTYRNGAVHFSS